MTYQLPLRGFLRLPQIIGNPKAIPPIQPIIPVSRTVWFERVKSGEYPKPVKLGKISAWRVEDIHALVNKIGDQNG